MRFFIINTDYIDFIRWLYTASPDLEKQGYAEQYRTRMESCFGTADFYSKNLIKLGHEARDVIANIAPMQKQWARENGIKIPAARLGIRLRRHFIPWPCKKEEWLYYILAEQIKTYCPDILYSMAVETIGSDFLKMVKGHYGIAIGQHAAPLPSHDVSGYDLMLSSLPNQVDYFCKQGMKSELFRLGFESELLDRVTPGSKRFDISFVGGLSGPHGEGAGTLEALCKNYSVQVWGYGYRGLALGSHIRKVFNGPLFGLAMYQALIESKIVFNRHINVAGSNANNMRLYEATGVGALLLTDYKHNLSDMFDPAREVIAYNNTDECVELAGYYLAHDKEREAIARAGQHRTLSEHTYYHRMQELVGIAQRYLS